MATQGRYTPAALYAHLVERMRSGSWWSDPEIIGIYQGSGCDAVEVGHALLPYRLEPQPNGIARIYVYDSNYPPKLGDAERYITIDLRANTWSYLIGNNRQGAPVVWTGRDLFGTPLHLFTEQPQLPYLDGNSIIAVGGRMRGSWGGGFTTWGRMRGSWGDFDTATSTGCLPTPNGLIYIENISGSMRLRPLSGYVPQAYYFPANKTPLTITGTGGGGQTNGDILLFGPHGVMGFASATSPDQDYSATVNPDFHTLTLRTTDTPRPMTAFQMQEAPDGSGTRIFAVSNVLVGADGAVSIAVSPDLSSVQVKNERNEPITFALGLANFSSVAVGSTTRTYTIEPHAVYSYTPIRWEDLAQPITVKQIKAGTRVTAGLVSLHRFDQGAGTIIRSSGGSAQGATLRITRRRAVQWVEGGLKIAAPTSLQASRSLAQQLQHLDAQGAFTLELWANPADRSGRVATLIDAAGAQVSLTLNQLRSVATVRYQLQLREGIDYKQASVSLLSRPVSRGSGPLHLVMTRDQDGQVRLFINGELQSTQRLRDQRGHDDDGPRRRHGGRIEDWQDREDERRSSSLTLANDREIDRPWFGSLRLFALYSRALSEEEIRQNYQLR